MSRRKRPAPPQNRPSRNHTNYAQSSGDYRHQAPTAEDRAVQLALDVLRQHGYGIAMRCLDCQHPITSAASLARMRGPRCEARHAESGVDEHLVGLRQQAMVLAETQAVNR